MTDRDTAEVNLGAGKRVTVTVGPDVDLDDEEFFLDGQRLTTERADEIAREIARRHGLRGGRPSLGRGRSPQVSTRLSADVHGKLNRLAAVQGRRPAELMREVIEEYLAEHVA